TARGIGRGAPQILREAGHVFEPRADLLRIEIDGEAPETDHVQRAVGSESSGVSHYSFPPRRGQILAEFRADRKRSWTTISKKGDRNRLRSHPLIVEENECRH